ncbi:MAG: aspartate/glutamate racemase family protein [Janthinobacterium lividum]
MATVGFLHTADAHVRTFRDLIAERDDSVGQRHLVDTGLLLTAREQAANRVRTALVDRLRRLRAEGADIVVCTCSTIGPIAKSVGAELGIRVMRVDRPMAEAAVLAGRRIAVVHSLDAAAATLVPLLRECATTTGRSIEIVPVRCAETWTAFESGDLTAYATGVADAVRCSVQSLEPPVDVVVLAQASMMSVAPLLRDLHLPVLTSPRLAVEAAVELVMPFGP